LDAIEKAVRNALEKGDAEDKNFRRRVYVSARHALENSMKGKKIAQRIADEKFARLSEVAASIESEFSIAEEAEDYMPQGRRSYEASAPLVDEVEEVAVSETAPAEPVGEELVIAAVPASEPVAEPVVIEDAEPLELSQTVEIPQAEPVAEVTEPVVTPEKPAKKSNARKKSAKKTVVEEAVALAETVSGGIDLFGKTEPVWDNVSIPPTYAEEPAAQPKPASSLSDELPSEEIIEPSLDLEPPQALSAEEPSDDSEEDMKDLHKLDGMGLNDTGTIEAPEPVLKAEESGARAPAEEAESDERYEVRPAAVSEADEPAVQKAAKPGSEPRRGWAFLFILITLLAFFIMALWIAFSTGALKIRGAAETPPVETVTVAPADQPAPAAEPAVPAPVSDDWLMIFRPDNPGDLVVDPTIKADIKGQGPLARLRIEPAPSTTGDAAVVFSIGQGILQQVAGKKAVFDIVAAADKGKPTQISVLCDFSGLGDCGRKRYQIDDATSDNLFQIEFPAGTPEGAGEFILNPDVDGKGRALEIYAIKVRVAN
jgi:hypothetical protein